MRPHRLRVPFGSMSRFALLGTLGLAASGAGCDEGAGASKPSCAFGVCEPGFHVVYTGTAGALLSAYAPDDDRTLAVGGPLGNAPGDLAVGRGLSADAPDWAALPALGEVSHWWIWGPGGALAYAVGERGDVRRLHFGTDGATSEVVAAGLTTATLYGVWGSGPDDVWAVGGDPLVGGEKDVILHFDGARWSRLAVPEPRGAAYFKIWGRGVDDVFIACQKGLILRIRGGASAPRFQWYDALPGRSVFTIHGNAAGEVWAVSTPAGIYRLDEAADRFEVVDPPVEGGGLNGVSVTPGGDVWIVGAAGTKWRRRADGTWDDFTLEAPRGVDLHAVLASDQGAVFVGGAYVEPPRAGSNREGVVGVYVEAD